MTNITHDEWQAAINEIEALGQKEVRPLSEGWLTREEWMTEHKIGHGKFDRLRREGVAAGIVEKAQGTRMRNGVACMRVDVYRPRKADANHGK